uniref:Fucolectin tachylectin-4 pentraxin-1 domain-containing protein n=1 Tax=Sinocyclocheilus anshuiensis TaxID=1608454 RepID=A0A671TBR6_9TELE
MKDLIHLLLWSSSTAACATSVIQSSTSGDWFAEKAIDGNRGLQQLYTGCSSTLNQTNPWWRVDLPHIYRVSRVVVTNRNDCCTEQINGAEIRIGNSLENNGNNNPICAVIPDIPAGESYRYSCGGMEGRYVNLIIPGNMKILTLCEVESQIYSIPTSSNIAINGKAVQSSTLPYEANKAIDNADLYCTHTETEANPWWRLDLMDLQVIQEVIVTNRIDCCFEQINGAEIRIGNSLENNGNNNPICAVISSIPAGVSSTYTCNGMEGRYVNLFIPGDTKYLTLCEVQVYEEGMMKQAELFHQQ